MPPWVRTVVLPDWRTAPCAQRVDGAVRNSSKRTAPPWRPCPDKLEIDANEAELVVIDTFAKVKRPGDAKGYEAEYQAIGDLKRLADETGVAVLVLHHTRKPSHEDAGSIFDAFLGSSTLSAGPNMLLIFDDRGDTLKLHGKGRLVEEFQLPLRWADPGFEIDIGRDK